MKIDDLSPKAREAFGKTLIDISLAIYKGVILLITVVPLAAIFKSAFSENQPDMQSIYEMLDGLSSSTKISIIALLAVAFLIAHYFRAEGIKHIHNSEA